MTMQFNENTAIYTIGFFIRNYGFEQKCPSEYVPMISGIMSKGISEESIKTIDEAIIFAIGKKAENLSYNLIRKKLENSSNKQDPIVKVSDLEILAYAVHHNLLSDKAKQNIDDDTNRILTNIVPVKYKKDLVNEIRTQYLNAITNLNK